VPVPLAADGFNNFQPSYRAPGIKLCNIIPEMALFAIRQNMQSFINNISERPRSHGEVFVIEIHSSSLNHPMERTALLH
jgi:hypothetical protein